MNSVLLAARLNGYPLRLVSLRRYSYESFFKSVAYSTPVTSVQSGLINAHEMFGSGNWAVDIMAGAVLFRTLISFPLGTLQRTFITAHSVKSNQELGLFAMQLQRAVRNKEVSQEEASNLAREKLQHLTSLKMLFDPQYKTFAKVVPIFLTEIVLWLCYSISLRNTIAGVPFEEAKIASLEMRSSGIAWISNLTESDPLVILPFITAISVFTSLRYMREWRRQNGLPEPALLRAVNVLAPPALCCSFIIMSFLPAGVTLHFATSATMGLIQSHLYCQPWFQRMVGTPKQLLHRPLSFKQWIGKRHK